MLNLYLHLNVTEDRPKYIGDESIIGVNPAMGFQPGQNEADIDSSLVRLKWNGNRDFYKGLDKEKRKLYDIDVEKETEKFIELGWIPRYEAFLKKYEDNKSDKLVTCGDGEAPRDVQWGKKSCAFDIKELKECGMDGKATNFGFYSSGANQIVQPCMILKMNRIFGWPTFVDGLTDLLAVQKQIGYTSGEIDDLEDEEDENKKPSKQVLDIMRADVAAQEAGDDGEKRTSRVYVDCQGENPADRELLAANPNSIRYFPSDQGFHMKYLPYRMTDDQGKVYQSPLLAIKLDLNADKAVGRLLHLQCKLWFKKVEHNSRDKVGLARMELFLDP